MTECPGRFDLMLWRVGDLDAGRAAEIAAHVDACPSCSGAAGHIDQDRATYDAEIDKHQESFRQGIEALRPRQESSPRRRSWLWWVPSLGFAAAAAAAVVLWVNPTTDPAAGISAPGYKGALTFQISCQRQGRQFFLEPSQGVRAGDRLGFVLSCDRAGHAALIAVDEAGQHVVLVPPPTADQHTAVRVKAGRQVLPGGANVDAQAGTYTLVLVHALQSFDSLTLAPRVASLLQSQGPQALNAEALGIEGQVQVRALPTNVELAP